MNTGGMNMPQPGGWGGMGSMNMPGGGQMPALASALQSSLQSSSPQIPNFQRPNPFANGGIPPMMPGTQQPGSAPMMRPPMFGAPQGGGNAQPAMPQFNPVGGGGGSRTMQFGGGGPSQGSPQPAMPLWMRQQF